MIFSSAAEPPRTAASTTELRELFAAIIADEAEAHRARIDVPPNHLAAYVVAAVGAADNLPDMASARRIVALVANAVRETGASPRAK